MTFCKAKMDAFLNRPSLDCPSRGCTAKLQDSPFDAGDWYAYECHRCKLFLIYEWIENPTSFSFGKRRLHALGELV